MFQFMILSGAIMALLASPECKVTTIEQERKVDLGKDLDSLLITGLDLESSKVSYIPVRVQVANVTGGALPNLEAVAFGPEQALVTGRLSIVADEKDIAELERRSQSLYGGQVQVAKVVPKAFGLWMYLEGEKVWTRGIAGGQVERIPVQLTVKAKMRGTSAIAEVATLLQWSERMLPINAKATVNWQVVAEGLRKKTDAAGLVVRADLEDVVDKLLSSRVIQVEVANGTGELTGVLRESVKQTLANQLVRVLFEGPQPIPRRDEKRRSQNMLAKGDTTTQSNPKGDDGSSIFSIAYRVKTDANIATESTVVDLSQTAYIDRSAVVRSRVRITY